MQNKQYGRGKPQMHTKDCLKGAIPLFFINYILHLVPSIHNTYKHQMLYYNWVILGDMFRPLNGHLRANIE